jgi:nitrile hydratase accessory protein
MPEPNDLPELLRDNDGPLFREPWEAQAFAITLKLHQAGCFSWSEWTTALGAEIAQGSMKAEQGDDEHYYLHWLSALENLVDAKGLASKTQLETRKQAWDRAARGTGHGQPIELPADDR